MVSTQLFPMIQPQLTARDDTLPLYREVKWDFINAQPVFYKGEPVVVTGKEAVKTWIWKALSTQRTRYEIYTWDHGSEVEALIGQNFSEETKKAEAARYVREALEVNPYITQVDVTNVSFASGDLNIDAVVLTVYGEVRIHV